MEDIYRALIHFLPSRAFKYTVLATIFSNSIGIGELKIFPEKHKHPGRWGVVRMHLTVNNQELLNSPSSRTLH